MSSGVLPVAVVAALLLVIAGVLGMRSLDQDRRIDRLNERLNALQRREVSTGRSLDVQANGVPSPVRAVDESTLDVVAGGALARAALRAKAGVPKPAEQPAPRTVVTEDDVARVESALLTLLDSEHAELNTKLRAVVQDEQAVIRREQHEERRERWITRIEADLVDFGKSAGLSADQSRSLLQILVASRDEINDILESAKTPEARTAASAKFASVSERRERELRELLTEAQYTAYQHEMNEGEGPFGRLRGRARN